jgi:hypothetical protein
LPLSSQAFGEPRSPEQVPADPVYLDMIASPTSYEACYADMSLVSVLTHALADAFLSFSEEASRRCAMGGPADASFPLLSSPLCSSPTHAVWPLCGGRRAAPHTELTLEEPLSENELRGLSGCRFLSNVALKGPLIDLPNGKPLQGL